MELALAEARAAAAEGEVPVGAVIVRAGQWVAGGRNSKEQGDPTAHAEIVAIRRAARIVGNWRLDDSVIYTTLEPCMMCLGAIMQSRVSRIIYGAKDSRFGAICSQIDGLRAEWTHQPVVVGGVLAEESKALLQLFFAERRQQKKESRHDSTGALRRNK